MQGAEVLRLITAGWPHQQLAIEHRAIAELIGQLHHIGEGLIDQLLAAAPQKYLTLPADELGPNAIPFPLRLPLIGLPWRGVLHLPRAGQKERIGPPRRRTTGLRF